MGSAGETHRTTINNGHHLQYLFGQGMCNTAGHVLDLMPVHASDKVWEQSKHQHKQPNGLATLMSGV